MLDGIRLSKDQTAVVALGIGSEGRKHVLDFAFGSSENLEASRELMSRIVNRGFNCDHRLYVVLDGSDAMRFAQRWLSSSPMRSSSVFGAQGTKHQRQALRASLG